MCELNNCIQFYLFFLTKTTSASNCIQFCGRKVLASNDVFFASPVTLYEWLPQKHAKTENREPN